MTENEIIAYYKAASDSRLIELAMEINTIKPEYRKHLFAELIVRDKESIVEEAKTRVNAPNHKVEKVKVNKTTLYYLPWVLLLFPLGVVIDHFFKLSVFSSDPSPDDITLIMDFIFVLIYFIPVYFAFVKRYLFVWITISLFGFWTLLLTFLLIGDGKAVDESLAIELAGRYGFLIYLFVAAVEAWKFQKRKDEIS